MCNNKGECAIFITAELTTNERRAGRPLLFSSKTRKNKGSRARENYGSGGLKSTWWPRQITCPPRRDSKQMHLFFLPHQPPSSIHFAPSRVTDARGSRHFHLACPARAATERHRAEIPLGPRLRKVFTVVLASLASFPKQFLPGCDVIPGGGPI